MKMSLIESLHILENMLISCNNINKNDFITIINKLKSAEQYIEYMKTKETFMEDSIC